jgi:hypothetical protein
MNKEKKTDRERYIDREAEMMATDRGTVRYRERKPATERDRETD